MMASIDCETCTHRQDDDCSRWERCTFCGDGFCYCDPMIDTEDGPMHKSCAKQGQLP